jgi:hypothetical protein
MPQLMWLVAGFSPKWPGFNFRAIQVVSAVDKVPLGQVFPQALANYHFTNVPHSSVAGTISPFDVAVPRDSS